MAELTIADCEDLLLLLAIAVLSLFFSVLMTIRSSEEDDDNDDGDSAHLAVGSRARNLVFLLHRHGEKADTSYMPMEDESVMHDNDSDNRMGSFIA